jgi:hypothetical protein
MEKYILIDQNGAGQPSGYSLKDGGEISKIDVKNAVTVPYQKINQNLFILVTEEQFNQIFKNHQSKIMQKNSSFVMAENVAGQEKLSRIETPFGGGMTEITLTLSINYSAPTNPAGPDLKLLLGDSANAMKTKDSTLDTLAACVANNCIIDGTFKTGTVAVINDFAKNQLRFSGLQAEANASSYWGNKVPARLLSSNIQGNPTTLDVDFNQNQDGSQFNDKIRRLPEFKFTLSDFTAMQISVNKGETLSVSFKIKSYGAAQIMELASL